MAVEIFDRLSAIKLPFLKSAKIFMDNGPKSQLVCVELSVDHKDNVSLDLMPKKDADAQSMVKKIEAAGGAFGIFALFSHFIGRINPREIEFLKKNGGIRPDEHISPASSTVRGVTLAQLWQMELISEATVHAIEEDLSKVLGKPLRAGDIQTTPFAQKAESFAQQIRRAAR